MFIRQLILKSLIIQDNPILLDKYEVEDLEHLKVDILANRGLSQLLEIDPDTALASYPHTDARTSALPSRGDVLGVTLRIPAMRRLFPIQSKANGGLCICYCNDKIVAMSGRQKVPMLPRLESKKLCKIVLYLKMML